MDKVIIITGSRKGLGRELAEYYLGKGNIVAGCSRGISGINHPSYTHYELDVADEFMVMKMVRDVARRHKHIDILLNNAGIASMNHMLLTPFNTVKEIFNTNYLGTFIFCREVSKVMVRQKFGRIVNFTTVAAPLRLEGEIAYANSKAAIENFTEIAARELADFNITVNAVGPTPIPTDLIKNVSAEKMQALIGRQAIKRFGTFNDLSNVTDFFIDDKSGFITGQVLYLGGVNK